MNKKDNARLQSIADENGMKFDSRASIVYGSRNGYLMAVVPGAQRGQFTIVTSASVGGSPVDQKALSKLVKPVKALFGCKVQRYYITFTVKSASFSINKTFERIPEGMTAVAQILSELGASNCCMDTGVTDSLDLYMCNGVASVLSPEAFAARNNSAVQADQTQFLKKENVVGGVVGAFLGSLIGVACIVLIGQMGYVAAISGFVMAICTLKGYEMLGGKLTKKGVVIGVVLMIAMTYVGNRADWALSISKQLTEAGIDWGFFDCFRAIPMWLEEEMIEASNYYLNLFMMYAFAIVGAFPTVKNGLTASPLSMGVYKLGAEAETTVSSTVDGDMM